MNAVIQRLGDFLLNVQPDTIDFRDLLYTPTLVEVATHLDLETYQKEEVPVLNQGKEGACTGFGLATVANYLLRKRKVDPDIYQVSPRMFYEMAKRYDEYPGEEYSGSSARGAMKGWHKHGVCAETVWVYKENDDKGNQLTHLRAEDARLRPLGAYFRVNHKDLVAMHSAISEVGILYATSSVHSDWNTVKSDGIINYSLDAKIIGGHAFAIVAYDQRGFWIQNSWGTSWGNHGFGLLSYDDWLGNGMDVWVARLGVPVHQNNQGGAISLRSPGSSQAASNSNVELRPHVISIGNDGLLKTDGEFGTSKQEIKTIFEDDIPRITKGWSKLRILLYAHGGLVSEAGFLQRLAEYRLTMLQKEIFPLAFIWHTDLWSTITNILQDAAKQRRPEGFLTDSLDFMLDRLDDTLEVIVRRLKVRALWNEMKENALLATSTDKSGGRLVTKHLAGLVDRFPGQVEIHLAGHSAGSIFHAPIVKYFTSDKGQGGLGRQIESCTLWAPAIQSALFYGTYLPAIQSRRLNRFALFTLTDQAEQDDNCANIYNKSLLYMVSNALENKIGEPILGMEKFIEKDNQLTDLFEDKSLNATWVKAPNQDKPPLASTARHHGDFDDNGPTLVSLLANILQTEQNPEAGVPIFNFHHSTSSLAAGRRKLGLINKS